MSLKTLFEKEKKIKIVFSKREKFSMFFDVKKDDFLNDESSSNHLLHIKQMMIQNINEMFET